MLKLFSLFVILLITCEFGYSKNITHNTECIFEEACVECHSIGDKFNNSFSEAQIPYKELMVKEFNTYRHNFAINNNISNMKYSIWMNDYQNLMKNMTLDIGDRSITCLDRLSGDGSHFTVVNIDTNENVNELILSLIKTNPTIIHRFDTSRFGCFIGVKTSSDNKPSYLLRCLFFIDNFIETRQMIGLPCANCAKDVQCSVQYTGLCGNTNSASSRGSSTAPNIKRTESYVINAILILVLSLYFKF